LRAEIKREIQKLDQFRSGAKELQGDLRDALETTEVMIQRKEVGEEEGKEHIAQYEDDLYDASSSFDRTSACIEFLEEAYRKGHVYAKWTHPTQTEGTPPKSVLGWGNITGVREDGFLILDLGFKKNQGGRLVTIEDTGDRHVVADPSNITLASPGEMAQIDAFREVNDEDGTSMTMARAAALAAARD